MDPKNTRGGVATRIVLTWFSLTQPAFADTTPSDCNSQGVQFGVAVAFRSVCSEVEQLRRLLWSANPEDRSTAYLRVAARHDQTGWRLLKLSQERPFVELSAPEELLLARVAAPHNQFPIVRSILTHLAYTTSTHLDSASPERRLALQIAVNALARSDAPESLQVLCSMLQRDGELSAAALDALSNFPPRPFARLFDDALPRSPDWAKLLGESRNPEAIPVLRRVLLESSLEMQFAAATALLKLRDPAMLPLVEQWTHNPDAPEEFKRLAELQGSVQASNFCPEPYALDIRTSQAVANLMSGAGRSGGDKSSSGRAEQGPLRLTAILLCHFSQCRPPEFPQSDWEKRLRDGGAEQRFVAAAVLSKIAPNALLGALSQQDPIIERAIGWALPYLPEDSPILPAATAILAASTDPNSPYCGTLFHAPSRSSVPFTQLLRLAFANGDCSPLGAEALAERAAPQWRLTLLSLLNSALPSIRAATAHGLGRNPAAFASGLLHARYLREGDTLVRRAIVQAFWVRKSRLGLAELAKTGHLDPDPIVRDWSTRMLRGERIALRPGDPLGSLEYGPRRRAAPLIFVLPRPAQSRTEEPHPRHVCGIDACSLPVIDDPLGQVLVPLGSTATHLECTESRQGRTCQ